MTGATTSKKAGQWLILLSACAITAGAQETNALLTLDRAIGIALARNPEAGEAQWRVDELAAQADLARSGRQPVLKARAAYDSYTEDQRLSQAASAGESGRPGLLSEAIRRRVPGRVIMIMMIRADTVRPGRTRLLTRRRPGRDEPEST